MPLTKKCLIGFLFSALLGCAYFQADDPQQSHIYGAITGKTLKAQTTSEEIKKILTKEESMAGGNYQIKVFPITRPYLQTFAREIADQRGLSSLQRELQWKGLQEQFLENKVCFGFGYSVVRFPQASQLKNWKLKLVDNQEARYPLTWKSKELEREAVQSRISRGSLDLEQWFHSGVGCTEGPFDLSQGFGVEVNVAYVQFPFSPRSTYYWEFDSFKTIEGQEVVHKVKKRHHQKYRAW